jgi:hypothetical protein
VAATLCFYLFLLFMLDLFSSFYLYKLHFLLNHSYTICREKCNQDFICIYLYVHFMSWTSHKKYATSTVFFIGATLSLMKCATTNRYSTWVALLHKKYRSPTNIRYELRFLLRKVQLFYMYFLIFQSCYFYDLRFSQEICN